MKKNNRKAALITSYVLAAFLVLGGFCYRNYKDAELYRYYSEQNFRRAFSELVTNTREIDSALQKSLYSTSSSMQKALYTEIFGKSMAAQMSLSQLPLSFDGSEAISSFIAKLGDYAYSLSKSDVLSQDEYSALQQLSQTASLLSQNLSDIQTQLDYGMISVSDADSSQLQNSLPQMSDSFQQIESEFPEIPSLIYDGPFSDHIDSLTPKLLDGLEILSRDEALAAAQAFSGKSLSFFGESYGKLPCYIFSSGDETVEITRQGGIVLSMFSSAVPETQLLSAQDAVSAAKSFLEEHGFENMKESYWSINNNILLANFASLSDGVTCYSDLVKVAVSLSDGSICGFESRGYIMNHTDRDLPEVTVSAEEISVSPELKVLSHSLALIPSMGKNEILCHEFKCENSDGQHYIVYVNAQTGREEKLLILLEDESGTLTM